MTYKLVDLRTEKVLGIYDTADQAAKAESRLMHVPVSYTHLTLPTIYSV